VKLHAIDPNVDEMILSIIDDIDGDEPVVEFHKNTQEAIEYVKKQYRNAPDSTEPEGETYEPGERPNAKIYIARVFLQTVI